LDHNPARGFLPKGAWPKGFVFPACEECNAGKRESESIAALVFNSFNIMDPITGGHREQTSRRLASFLNRDPELFESLQKQLSEPGFSFANTAVQIPLKYKLGVLRVGVSLFQAIYYRMTGTVSAPDHHVLIRFITNKPDPDERGPVEEFFSKLDQHIPDTIDPKAQGRFAYGVKKASNGWVFLGAEIKVSTAWIGHISQQPPDEIVAERFDWFSGAGRLLRSSDPDERAATEAASD
jgi:hypothetical protein